MSMFYMVEASGALNRSGKQLARGLTSFSQPEHMPKQAILDWIEEAKFDSSVDTSHIILEKAYAPRVQVLDTWDSYGSRSYSLLVKAMGFNQADELARDFGKRLVPDYLRKQEEAKAYKKRVKKFMDEGRELFGEGAVFTVGKRRK